MQSMSKQENITRKKFNYLKKYYDETWDEDQHTLHVGLFKNKKDSLNEAYAQATEHLIENVEAILPIDKNSNILDVGCGTGRTLIDICAKFGCCGIGIDLSDEQIKDAEIYLNKLNRERAQQEISRINAKFIRSSGSSLDDIFRKDNEFTHIISQDAILLVENKKSLFSNIHRLLVPGGVFAAADFLSESSIKERTKKEENLIYKLVNWNKGLSFEDYNGILKAVGLEIIKSERRDEDMLMTYEKLAKKMDEYSTGKEKTYSELRERYEAIAVAVKNGKMGWGFFFAQKPPRKTAVIAGTKNKSIGRFVAEYLHKNGWDVWLYSRSAKKTDKLFWHERRCDISKEKDVQGLLAEIKNLDLVMMLADSGEGHLPLEELSEKNVKTFIDSKILGSILLIKSIILKFSEQNRPIKVAWCGGKISKKPKDLVLYGVVNSGLAILINELNNHYSDILKAYYFPTPIISPSTIGDEYIKKMGRSFKALAKPPKIIIDMVEQILEDKSEPGMLEVKTKIL